MPWWANLLPLFWAGWVFVLGLGVGSFLNVLIARLPYEKSIVWPGSRCFTCFKPIRMLDNLPVIGYLRLRGKCRSCGAKFSPRYLFVEIGTGLAFLALYALEIGTQMTEGPAWLQPWHFAPGLHWRMFDGGPKLAGWVYFASHAFLLAALIASAVIDAKHRIIPPQITYVGTLVGLAVSTAFPWPWPNNTPVLNPLFAWGGSQLPEGIAMLPYWGPPFEFAPMGSHLMGLMNGLIGAAVGMAIVRGIKLFFEIGLGKEALGLGDADLLMMSGAFLGWQAIALALPVGAFLTLFIVIPLMVWGRIRGKTREPQLAFGPGIAAGVVACWWGWPWLGPLVQPVFFDPFMIGALLLFLAGGLLVGGLFLRK